MDITVLTGGVGGARFLLGVKAFLGWDPTGAAPTDGPDRITAVVNTADDLRLHGLQICPDLDSCMYTLGGGADVARGWGRTDETWAVSAELAAYDAEAPWFSLGDKDIATHLVRTRMLDAGYPLSAVTEALCARWQPGVRLLPMSDDRVETHVVVPDPQAGPTPVDGAVDDGATGSDTVQPGERPLVALHFQEWWIRYRAGLPALSITPIGAAEATAGPGVVEAITGADVVLIAPSNPVVSVGPILAVPAVAAALRETTAPVVAVSPIIGGKPVRGHADACLAAIGVESSAEGVGRHYGARSDGGLLDAFLVAEQDIAEMPGVRVGTAPLLMTDPAATAAMVRACLDLVDVRV
ncbi:2-phospho-L-lactate transferase CofD family protein [Nakamurella leprariae]|uniref:2-phospho-L-lactate transferase n=1 Tax=Nakamurella leprariae TaxID=2803911 RepID=A0A938YGJ8_9ACTN|nr:2-phospho-L-lactate transferase CofD family protein [Nakamurella leprariae]MBM9467729.1 2-phospho-L-lactate transferase [Nakamurella leprariae]